MSQADFSTSPIIIALLPEILADVQTAREIYGAILPIRPADPASPVLQTLLGHPDRVGSPDLRAGLLGDSVLPEPLTDGRLSFTGYFATAFLDALSEDPLLSGVQILSPEQLETLRETE